MRIIIWQQRGLKYIPAFKNDLGCFREVFTVLHSRIRSRVLYVIVIAVCFHLVNPRRYCAAYLTEQRSPIVVASEALYSHII